MKEAGLNKASGGTHRDLCQGLRGRLRGGLKGFQGVEGGPVRREDLMVSPG